MDPKLDSDKYFARDMTSILRGTSFHLGHAMQYYELRGSDYSGQSEFKVTVFMRCTLMDGQYSPLQEVLTRGVMIQKKTFSFFLKEGNVCKFAAVSNSD